MASVYETVLATVLTNLQTALTPLGFPNSRVVRRPRPSYVKELDTLPLVMVCGGKDDIAGRNTNDNVWIDYQVYVVVLASNALIKIDSPVMRDLREVIRNTLFKHYLPGYSPPVFFCAYDSEPVYDLSQLRMQFDASAQLFTYRTSETQEQS